MKRAIIETELCKQCDTCLAASACPNGAIWLEEGEAPVVAIGCMGCRKCVEACPYGASKVI